MSKTQILTIDNQYEAPRWAGVGQFVRTTASRLGLQCELIVQKHWLRESGSLKISGEPTAVLAFAKAYNQAIERYNIETS